MTKAITRVDNDHLTSYKLALTVSVLVFLVLLGTLMWMSLTFTGELTEVQDTLKTTTDSLLKASAGVIFGLVSGKSLS